MELIEVPEDVQVEECIELKNIQYKTMLLNGKPIKETKSASDLTNLEEFLENEKNNNQSEPWCKLNKTMKLKKLIEYARIYKEKNLLEDEEEVAMEKFFRECLEKKKLYRVKDVSYNKETGVIIDIPSLVYAKSKKHFTLKNTDKRASTLNSLTPKKMITKDRSSKHEI
jgi:hypothetical protein